MLILNFKTYPQVTLRNSSEVLRVILAKSKELNLPSNQVFVSPAHIDLRGVQSQVEASGSDIVKVMAQSFSPKDPGSTTGSIPPQQLVKMGVEYSLINHSEARLANVEEIKIHLDVARQAGLKVIVCSESIPESEQFKGLEPFAIALEPPELIGSGQSISEYRPQEVQSFVDLLSDSEIKTLIGAGISTAADIKKGLELGAQGFLLASAFAKADDWSEKFTELTSPFLQTD